MKRIHSSYLSPLKVLISIFLFATLSNCSQNSTDPPSAGVDTTGHNFVWQVEALGDLTSSLADVFAISDNNIWAVGKIEVEDSLGNDAVYNSVQWDGQKWKLQIISVDFRGNEIVVPLKDIFSFSPENIWLSSGLPINKQNDQSQLFHLFDMGILSDEDGGVEHVWGSNSDNLYFVGNKGSIVHFDGNIWQKQESNTSVRLVDIWGDTNGNNVWACGYASNNSESILLHYNGSQWRTAWRWHYQQGSSDTNYVGLLSSLWRFHPDSLMIVSSDGIFRQDVRGNAPPRKESFNLDAFPFSVRGSASNNIFICGDNGSIWHFNGATWQTYPELHNSTWVFRSVTVLENKVIVVGADYSQGIQRDIIVTGERP